MTSTSRAPRDRWVMIGMSIAATSAAVASFTGLRGLALVAGWPGRLAWLLPVTIDAYAMTSARVWLSGATQARRFARANAIGAIMASILGNAVYHTISVGLLDVSWPIIVVVGAVPAAVLGLTAHLHALRTVDASRSPNTTERESGPEDRPQTRRTTTTDAPRRARARRRGKARTGDELLAAARDADASYRAANDDRPITRDALRTALRIGGQRATELRRILVAEATDTPDRKEAHTHS